MPRIVQSKVPPGRAPPGTQALTSKEREPPASLDTILSHSSSYCTAPFSYIGAATISPARDTRWYSIRSIPSYSKHTDRPAAEEPLLR